MTGLVDRLNAWVLARRRPSQTARCEGDAIRVAGQSYDLTSLTRAVGCQEELYGGQRLGLILEFGAAGIVRLSQEDACWAEVLAALDRLELTAEPSKRWTLRLLAGESSRVLRS